MTEFTGKDMYVKFGTTQVLSGRYKSFEETEEAGLVDHSAGADLARTYLKTLEDGSATLEANINSTGSATLWAAVKPGTEATLLWAEEGTALGKPRHSVNALVKSRKKNIVHDDVCKLSVEFQFSGALTDDTY